MDKTPAHHNLYHHTKPSHYSWHLPNIMSPNYPQLEIFNLVSSAPYSAHIIAPFGTVLWAQLYGTRSFQHLLNKMNLKASL